MKGFEEGRQKGYEEGLIRAEEENEANIVKISGFLKKAWKNLNRDQQRKRKMPQRISGRIKRYCCGSG